MRPNSAVEARPLKVLHVLYELQPSGLETMLRIAKPHFDRHGIQGAILATGPIEGGFAGELRKAGYDITHLRYRRHPNFFLQLRKFVRAGKYDIIHIHTERSPFWYALSVLGVGKIVRTVHNISPVEGQLWLRRRIGRSLVRWFGVRQLAVGPAVQENEWERFQNPTTLCMNWYDDVLYYPPSREERQQARQSFGLRPDEVVVVTVGNCEPTKNHGAFIAALAQLRDDKSWIYLHVGAESPGQPERALAEHLGIGDRTRFLGPLEDVRSVYYAADLFVMSSLIEGLSIAVIEALACGRPALLADSPGLRDLRQWFPGLFYAPPTPGGLAERFKEFLAMSRPQREALSISYPHIVQSMFGIESGVERYVAIYRQITQHAARPRAS